jgi:hypothetical protein
MYISKILIFTVLLVILIVTILFIYRKVKQYKYTREKFVFDNTNTLAVFIIFSLLGFSPISPVSAFFNSIKKIIGKKQDFPVLTMTLENKVILLIIYILWGVYIYKVYENWGKKNEVISEHQGEELMGRSKKSIFKDYTKYFNHFINNETIKIYDPVENYETITDISIKKQNWFRVAADLLVMYDKNFKINEKDWHKINNCYISFYGIRKICIVCSNEKIDKKMIAKAIKYANKYLNENIYAIYNIINEEKSINEKNGNLIIMSKGYLIDNLVDFTEHKKNIMYNFKDKNIIPGEIYKHIDIYTQPNFFKIDRKEKNKRINIEDIKTYVEYWLKDESKNRHLAILGEYGQGKTVFLEKIAYDIVTGNIKSNKIPIILELKGTFPAQFSEYKLLEMWAKYQGFNSEAIILLYRIGKLLIMFDGFDETQLASDYNTRYEHFKVLMNFCDSTSKIIISGRPNYFINDKELAKLLVTNGRYGIGCEELYIKKFNEQQIINSLRAQKNTTTKVKILNAIKANRTFKDLMSRPALLFFAQIIWEERLSKVKNITSAKVLKEFLNYSYSRQADKKLNTNPLNNEEREFFMLVIATKMITINGYTNLISLNELKNIVREVIERYPLILTNYFKEHYPRYIPIKERVEKNKKYEDIIFNDIISCGILVRKIESGDMFKFAHKSFLEYLGSLYSALNVTKKYTNTKEEESYESIMIVAINQIYSQNIYIPKTLEIIQFMAQIYCEKCNDEYKNLTNDKIVHKAFRKIISSLSTRYFISLLSISNRVNNGIIWLGILLVPNFAKKNLRLSKSDSFTRAELFEKVMKEENRNVSAMLLFRLNSVLLGVIFVISLLMVIINRISLKELRLTSLLFSSVIAIMSLSTVLSVISKRIIIRSTYGGNLTVIESQLLFYYHVCVELIGREEGENLINKDLLSYIKRKMNYKRLYGDDIL